jgi:hypothetical protein
MVETMFQAGFVFALVLPPLTVLAGVIFLLAPRLHSTPHVRNAPVHP